MPDDTTLRCYFNCYNPLECLGYSVESDRGGAYAYIESYCQEHEADLLTTCTDLLDRACAAVALLLDTAQEISVPAVSAA